MAATPGEDLGAALDLLMEMADEQIPDDETDADPAAQQQEKTLDATSCITSSASEADDAPMFDLDCEGAELLKKPQQPEEESASSALGVSSSAAAGIESSP